MEISDLICALRSGLRRRVISLLSTGPQTIDEMFLKMKDSSVSHYSSVYKATEILVNRGFVNKYYDMKAKKIRYALHIKKLTINLAEMRVIVDNGE